jgi:hypothetical protein
VDRPNPNEPLQNADIDGYANQQDLKLEQKQDKQL